MKRTFKDKNIIDAINSNNGNQLIMNFFEIRNIPVKNILNPFNEKIGYIVSSDSDRTSPGMEYVKYTDTDILITNYSTELDRLYLELCNYIESLPAKIRKQKLSKI